MAHAILFLFCAMHYSNSAKALTRQKLFIFSYRNLKYLPLLFLRIWSILFIPWYLNPWLDIVPQSSWATRTTIRRFSIYTWYIFCIHLLMISRGGMILKCKCMVVEATCEFYSSPKWHYFSIAIHVMRAVNGSVFLQQSRPLLPLYSNFWSNHLLFLIFISHIKCTNILHPHIITSRSDLVKFPYKCQECIIVN